MGAATGTTTIGNALVVTGNASAANFSTAGDLAVNGGDITSTSATLNVGASGNTVAMLGALTVAQNATVTGDLGVNGGDITTTSGTFNLLNSAATTINFGGAADINMSTAGKTTTIAGGTNIVGTLNVTQATTLQAALILVSSGNPDALYTDVVPTNRPTPTAVGELRMSGEANLWLCTDFSTPTWRMISLV
jgi:hypothetical protein